MTSNLLNSMIQPIAQCRLFYGNDISWAYDSSTDQLLGCMQHDVTMGHQLSRQTETSATELSRGGDWEW